MATTIFLGESQRRAELSMRLNMLLHFQHYALLKERGIASDAGTDRLGGIKTFVENRARNRRSDHAQSSCPRTFRADRANPHA